MHEKSMVGFPQGPYAFQDDHCDAQDDHPEQDHVKSSAGLRIGAKDDGIYFFPGPHLHPKLGYFGVWKQKRLNGIE